MEDIRCSSAEIVYGAPLLVPREFIGDTPTCTLEELLSELREKIQGLITVPASQHGVRLGSLPKDLKQSQFMFVRHDAHQYPLQKPYDGPYHVITAGDKTFNAQMGYREEFVSVDRLKAAHMDFDSSAQSSPVQVAQHPLLG